MVRRLLIGIVGVMLVGALALAGVGRVLAQEENGPARRFIDRVAEIVGVEPGELRSAVRQARQESGWRGRGFFARPGARIGEEVGAVAEFLGMSRSELRAQLRDGRSLAEIAGPERTPELIALIERLARERVQDAREAGRITAEEATRATGGLRARVTEAVNAEGIRGIVRTLRGNGAFDGCRDRDDGETPEDAGTPSDAQTNSF